MVKFAVIGTSLITKKFINAMETCPECALHAVYSRSLDKAVAFGISLGAERFYDNLDEMAKDKEIDVVYIASPNSFHYSHVMVMLKAKKHVICEKPLTTTKEQAEEMFKTAQENQVILQEAMRSVYEPGVKVIEDLLPKLGTVRRISFPYAKYSSKYDSFLAGNEENIFNPNMEAGALMDLGVYCVHLLVHLFGLPKDVQASSVRLRNGVDGAGTIVASYKDKVAELMYSKISTNVLPAQIQGEKGTMLIYDLTEIERIEMLYFDGREKEIITVDHTDKNNLVYEIKAFLGFLVDRKSLSKYQNSSLMALDVIEKAKRVGN